MKTPLVFALAGLALGLGSCSKDLTCAADETNVDGTCYALQSDSSNCGTRGHACSADRGCSRGTCVDCTSAGTACLPAVVATCYNLNQVRPLGENLAPAAAPIATDSGPIKFASLNGKLYAANSTASSISAITLTPPSATTGSGAIAVPSGSAGFGDLEYLSAHGGLLWASNAAAGTLVAIDPAKGVIEEIALPLPAHGSTNPQGIDFVGTTGYLALQGLNALAVLDLSTVPGGKVTQLIDLTSLSSNGANAAPTRVLAVGSRVYVTLNNLFDAKYAPVAGAYGRLAVVDATSNTLKGGALDLGSSCLDAGGLALSGTTLWVACGYFNWLGGANAVTGAAFVPVDLASGAPVVGNAITLSNAATNIVFCKGRGYAGASNSGTVLAFDPASRAVTSMLACPPAAGKASYVPDVTCAP